MDKTFNLAPNILGPNSSSSISVSANTDGDVLQAIAKNDPFPTRPDGKIPLGNIALAANGQPVNFKANGGSVSFGFQASFRTGAGVFDRAADAIGSLQLDAPSALNLDIPGGPTDRYLLMLLGYKASGSFSASHPIGVIGSLTFGATASAGGLYAVMHRFAGNDGAATVLGTTVSSWRLPRQIESVDDLKPGTWLIAEADGSLAISLKAQMGYDFNFVRQAHLLGMTRELGAKIDAGLSATLGFSVSGKHIVCIGRETDGPVYRLRLFKQKTKGISAGLNVTVGVTGQAQLPGNLDDFVKAVFGVHGEQVVRDLQIIRQWTDPNTDLSDTVARLINKTGLDLLTDVTGIDARAAFNAARQKILDVFALWDGLSERASAALWKILGTFGGSEIATFKTFLQALADPDPAASNQALAQALQKVTFGDTPEGQWLAAIAERGLLKLSDQLVEVRQIAGQTLQILNGGEIKKLQEFINARLNLDQIRNIVTANDFDKVDGWLIARLSDFFDKKLKFEDLDEIRAAINGVFTKAAEIYDKSLKALNNRYSFEFAATYEKTTQGQALLDVEFDMSQPPAAAALREVVVNGKLDNLLVNEIGGVTLNVATLSHQIKRRTDVQIHMPFFDSETEHINDSIATMAVEHDGGRVLAYQLNAKDKVTIKNRYMSQLSVLGALRVKDGQITVGAAEDQSIVYQQLQIKSRTTLKELEFRTAPFVRRMLNGVFADDGAIDNFYLDLDQTVSNVLHTPPNNFGDVAISLQVDLPAAVLAAWFNKLDDDGLRNATMMMSRSLQAHFKSLLLSTFFQDVTKLRQNESAAALLTWAAFPISTSISFVDGQIKRFNTDKDVFWNWPDKDLRRAMVSDDRTSGSLGASMAAARDRLLDAGDGHNAGFFVPSEVGDFKKLATNPTGDALLQSLLITETELVRGAASALNDVQQSLNDMPTAPTKAIVRLAEFGAKITDTFNNKLSIYGNEALRPLSSMLLLAASGALSPGALATPRAMLNLYVLNSQHAFDLKQFLAGELPAQSDVAVAQTLTTLGLNP
jgi:hypothetical protein